VAGERASFAVGDLVGHRLFGYRGVVFDVDPCFCGTDEWYEQVARSRPPKDAPWYHVLVDGATHTTYVAERNLEPDPSGAPVAHPLLDALFEGFEQGRYVRRQQRH
jgi:heat shock protein HspQ